MTLPRRAFLTAVSAAALTGRVGPGSIPVEGQLADTSSHYRAEPEPGARRRTVRSTHRGVNLSGAEFTPDARHLPGVADTDYRYPTRADVRYVAGRGHRVIRLPIRWERIQPALLGPLREAELQRLVAVLEHAHRSGVQVLVDLHNYARFVQPPSRGGATWVLGDGRLTNAHLVDLWARLSAALQHHPAVLGYGLMNEPHHLPMTSGGGVGTSTVVSFDDGTGPWAGEADATVSHSTAAGTTRDGGGSLRITRKLSAGGSQVIRANDQAASVLVSTADGTLAGWVLIPQGAPGTRWRAQLEVQDASYRWRAGPSTELIPGRWTRISVTPDASTWAAHRAVGVQFSSDQSGTGTADVYLDSIQRESRTIAGRSQADQWEQASQECVDAIRSRQDSTPVYVSGVAFSGAQTWPQNHPAPWIDDPAHATVYEAHYYFDRDNSGTYQRPFASEDADAVRRGYASLEHRATAELGRFLDWCGTHAVPGFVGEIGWDNRQDTGSWNAVGDALYRAMDEARVGATYWAAGPWYGTRYPLSIYTGTPLSRRAAPAAVVEAHPGFAG